jgi:hypothetical protein
LRFGLFAFRSRGMGQEAALVLKSLAAPYLADGTR